MAISKIWEEDFKVLTFHMDPKGRAHLSSICNFLQEGASMHAETAGFGFDEMLRRNQVWVLARLKVNISRFPVWKENLKLKTWSRGKEGIFYIRDFFIEDEHNNIIVKSSSSWAAINLKSRRPELVDGLEKGLFTLEDQKAFPEKLNKIPALQNATLLRKRKIEYTDIDLVYHENNVKYIELIINSIPKEKHLDKKISTLEINYLGEVKYDEVVLIYSDSTNENTQEFSIVREEDNKEVCRARMVWL